MPKIYIIYEYQLNSQYLLKGGGGGGRGRSGLSFWKNKFRVTVVLGPYVQCCPCEASEQKLGQKPEYVLKVMELSYCHHSICL